MGYQYELRHFRYFLTLAEELHFRKAAEKLYISQPALSRQIKQLEESLGVVLFNRTNKKVALSTAGAFLAKELRFTFEQLNQAVTQAQLIQEGVRGKIRMGYVGSAMQSVIPSLLLRFKDEDANIHFSLQELDNRKQVDALLKGEIDIGFVRAAQVPNGLSLQTVHEEPFSLVVPADLQLTVDSFDSLLQLADENFILFEETYSPSYYAKVMSIFNDAGFLPKVAHNTVHAATIFRLVENHFGVSIVPSSLHLGYNLNVRFIELHDIPQRAVLSMVWNKENSNPVLDQVIEWALKK